MAHRDSHRARAACDQRLQVCPADDGLVHAREWPSAGQVDRLQWASFEGAPEEPSDADVNGLFAMIRANHAWNRLLWMEEDQARRRGRAVARFSGAHRRSPTLEWST